MLYHRVRNMARKDEYVDYLLECLESTGPVRAKSMFGGYGLYMDDLMFALVADDVLYFKTSENNISDYLDRNLKPFRYDRGSKQITMSYHEAPAEVFDDPEIMSIWANKAIGSALGLRKKLKQNPR